MKIFGGFIGGAIVGFLVGAGYINVEFNFDKSEFDKVTEAIADKASDATAAIKKEIK